MKSMKELIESVKFDNRDIDYVVDYIGDIEQLYGEILNKVSQLTSQFYRARGRLSPGNKNLGRINDAERIVVETETIMLANHHRLSKMLSDALDYQERIGIKNPKNEKVFSIKWKS